MKRYAALLRGINQSGKNKISMADLKKMFCDLGFAEVETVLNSGNVLFSSDSDDITRMSYQITDRIRQDFGFEIPVGIWKTEHLASVMDHAPAWWGTDDKSRYHNLIFILTDESPDEICRLIGEPSEGKERIEVFDDVIFWSFDPGCYRKCNWWKRTAAKGIAEKLTIRTRNTIKRICGRKERMIAACGNDCSACPRYTAYPYEKTDEELRHTAELWMKIGYRDHVVSNEEISCTGCKPENWCRYHVIRCCRDKGIGTCAQCDAYPCGNMKECFAITGSFEPKCRQVCTRQEYDQLKKAFFEKEQNLKELYHNSLMKKP